MCVDQGRVTISSKANGRYLYCMNDRRVRLVGIRFADRAQPVVQFYRRVATFVFVLLVRRIRRAELYAALALCRRWTGPFCNAQLASFGIQCVSLHFSTSSLASVRLSKSYIWGWEWKWVLGTREAAKPWKKTTESAHHRARPRKACSSHTVNIRAAL